MRKKKLKLEAEEENKRYEASEIVVLCFVVVSGFFSRSLFCFWRKKEM